MLPKTLKYGSKVEPQACKSYRSNITPINAGTLGLSETCIIQIPTRNNLCLIPSESYLKFDLQINNKQATAANYRLPSCGAHSIIDRIRIFHGSNLLSDISAYNQLASLLFDLQCPTDASQGKYNILAGTRNDYSVKDGAIAEFGPDDTITRAEIIAGLGVQEVVNVNTGEVLGLNIANNASTTSRTYCLNLVSLLGTLCSHQYIPLFACTSAPLRMEITFVDTICKAVCTNKGLSSEASLSVSNIEYVAQMLELNDASVQMIYESLGGAPLQFVIPDYRNFPSTFAVVNGVQSSYNFPIPAKFSSLKSVFISLRDKNTGANTFYPNSSTTNGVSSYSFRVGSIVMPSKEPNKYPEMYAELLKAGGSLSDVSVQPSIDLITYTLKNSLADDFTKKNINAGSFYIGLDLENFAGASKDTIFSGYNSNNDDIFCMINFDVSASANTIRLDSFALFDEVIVFENNTAYVRF